MISWMLVFYISVGPLSVPMHLDGFTSLETCTAQGKVTTAAIARSESHFECIRVER